MAMTVRGRDTVYRNFQEYARRYHAVARTTLEEQAAIVEQRMKDERRWEDRTGDARANLRCRVYDTGRSLRLSASHGVPYGVYLEHGHQGRFAILQPTVSSQWPIAMKAVAAAVKAIKL